jgi:hypothetical protein
MPIPYSFVHIRKTSTGDRSTVTFNLNAVDEDASGQVIVMLQRVVNELLNLRLTVWVAEVSI